jgi:RHS repeat-associated protein
VLTGYDELYLYDGLNRLKDQIRGTLNGTQTAITTRTFQQQWGLDATGNWQAFKQDTDGNGTWDLVQSRTANKANEITAINNTTGTAWVTPGYDRAGNMIGIPNPTISSTATYDAWNRLISVTDASTSITNDYDARGFRITETTGGVVRRYHYTPGWQCVEERTGSLTTPERQFVWEQLRPPTDEGGSRPKAVAGNVDSDLVIRDRSTANNGTINERRYAMQDGNWNTIAICDTTGSVGERYAYSAYGAPVFMTGAGVVQSASAIGFETLYAGYRWDNPAPQMYYVRNRFLFPQVGTWNKRDPLGYVDRMTLYAYGPRSPVTGLDTFGQDWNMMPIWGTGSALAGRKRKHKQCIFSMDSENEDDCKRWDIECRKLQVSLGNSAYYRKVHKQQSILNRILENGCCDVRFVGHQGAAATNGGIVTYPASDGHKTIILPDPQFEAKLKAAFKTNNCANCSIYIYACGGNVPQAPTTRTNIATRTGCTVYGARPLNAQAEPFITIGECPQQGWYSLDPTTEPNDYWSPYGQTGVGNCLGTVPLTQYPPRVSPPKSQENIE